MPRIKRWGFIPPAIVNQINNGSPLAIGLKAYWPLNEGGGVGFVKDLVTPLHRGTLVNMLDGGWKSGRFGKSLNFDNTNDYINAGVADDILLVGSPCSVSAWIYANSIGQTAGRIISKETGSSSTNSIAITTRGTNTIGLGVAGVVALQRITANNTLLLGQWLHVVVVYDGSAIGANQHIYINGIEPAYSSTADATVPGANAGSSINIGGTSSANRTFDGQIANLKVWNRVLARSEVLRDYQNPYELLAPPRRRRTLNRRITTTTILGLIRIKSRKSWGAIKPPSGSKQNWSHPLSRGLVGHWIFNEGGGLVARDLTFNNQNCTLNNFNQTITSGWNPGRFGSKTLVFDGINDGLSATVLTGQPLDITTNRISFGGWIYPTASSNYQFIVGRAYDDITTRQYAIYLTGGATSQFYWALQGVGGNSNISLSTNWTVNAWNHVYLVYDGATVFFYLNAQKVATSAVSGNITTLSGAALRIGSNGSNYFVTGKLEDIRIYNRALSGMEIKRLYMDPYSDIVKVTRKILFLKIGSTPPPPPPSNVGIMTPRSGWWGDL